MADETRGTVVIALAANVAVAAAKLAAGLLTGSAAMLSEAAHSFADTLNEVFLLVSLRRSARPADRTHPFGYGKERFFYSLLAAVGIFVSGAGFAAYQGVEAITGAGAEHEPSTLEFVAIYVVLAVSLVLEGASLRKALRQVAAEARAAGRSFLKYVVRSPDPTVKTVASEDTVAVVGVLVAFGGTLAHQLLGSAVWDGVASLVIAGLLAYVAVVLGRDTKELLIGEAADPVVRTTAYAVISSYPEIVAVQDVLTMQLGPSAVLLAARVQFDDDLRGADVERVATEIEATLRDRIPDIVQVFLDPSRVTADDLVLLGEHVSATLADLTDLDGPEGLTRLDLPARTRPGRRMRSRVR